MKISGDVKQKCYCCPHRDPGNTVSIATMPTMSTKPGPEVGLEEEEECTFPCWRTLPDHILLHIFSFLGASTLAKVLLCFLCEK